MKMDLDDILNEDEDVEEEEPDKEGVQAEGSGESENKEEGNRINLDDITQLDDEDTDDTATGEAPKTDL